MGGYELCSLIVFQKRPGVILLKGLLQLGLGIHEIPDRMGGRRRCDE